MRRLLLAVPLAAANKADPRLASVRQAFIVAIDNLEEDRPVAACLADHLTQLTPIVAVTTREDADDRR